MVTDDLNYVILEDLDFMEDSTLIQIINHPYILAKYLENVYYQSKFKFSEDLINKTQSILDVFRRSLPQKLVRIRMFKPEGIYCGACFKKTDGEYFFLNDKPILITQFNQEQLCEQLPGFLLRQEVRLCASIALGLQATSYSFNFLYNTYDIPYDLVSDQQDISEIKVLAVMRILSRIGDAECSFKEPKITAESKFKFSTKFYSHEKSSLVYSKFNIKDDLLLRTSFLILKSKILWDQPSRLYAEDACSNLFVGIEGILRLISQRIINAEQFEVMPTIAHIKKFYGDNLGRLLQDIYDKRVQIIHPAESLWMPDLSDDDYYDNYEIAMELMYYAITSERGGRDSMIL